MTAADRPEFSDEAVGERLYLLRKRLADGISQTAMAELIGKKVGGMTQQSWGLYENGKRHLDTKVANCLCNDYHVTLDWIYRGSTMMLPVGVKDKLFTEEVRQRSKRRAASSA